MDGLTKALGVAHRATPNLQGVGPGRRPEGSGQGTGRPEVERTPVGVLASLGKRPDPWARQLAMSAQGQRREGAFRARMDAKVVGMGVGHARSDGRNEAQGRVAESEVKNGLVSFTSGIFLHFRRVRLALNTGGRSAKMPFAWCSGPS